MAMKTIRCYRIQRDHNIGFSSTYSPPQVDRMWGVGILSWLRGIPNSICLRETIDSMCPFLQHALLCHRGGRKHDPCLLGSFGQSGLKGHMWCGDEKYTFTSLYTYIYDYNIYIYILVHNHAYRLAYLHM